jgi:hypothetical protein
LEDDDLGKLGFWSIAVLYLSVAIGSFVSTPITKKLGDVKAMALGSLMNTPWILSLALAGLRGDFEGDGPKPFYLKSSFITTLVIILSILNGFGQAIQWVGQGTYISNCATEETKGFFFSYFWAFYMSSQIFGSIIAAYCLRQYSQANLFVIMGVISFLSSVSSFFLKQPTIDELSSTTRHSFVNQAAITSSNHGSGESATSNQEGVILREEEYRITTRG